MEILEGRRLLSLDAPFGSPVNATTRREQFDADNATNSRGRTVVVWTDTPISTNHDIRAQRYNSAGFKIGPEIAVSLSDLDESDPQVAVDDFGNFVITWTQDDRGDANVVAQRYDPDGRKVGSLIQVANSANSESEPDIATNVSGDFVVSYTREDESDNEDIVYVRYDGEGNPIAEDTPASSPDKDESNSQIAMSRTGQVNIVWETETESDDRDIYLGRYDRNDNYRGARPIATTSAYDESPAISMDDKSNAVVAWTSDDDILAVRVTSSGRVSSPITIAASSSFESDPSVALKRGGGGFVVTYQRATSSTSRAMVAEVSSSNRVTTITAGTYEGQTVSINSSGIYFTTYTVETGRDTNIRARRGRLRV